MKEYMINKVQFYCLAFVILPFLSGCNPDRAEIAQLDEPVLNMVKLTGGPWKNTMELERDYLLSLDPERLLFHFKKVSGIETNASEYGGWETESRELRGHSIGHYLSAISRMAVLTNDTTLLNRCAYTVSELKKCQEKTGTGYLSAWPEEYLDRVETLQQVWAPYYTLHKILAGLFDAYMYCNNKEALDVAINLSHYLYDRIAPLGRPHFQEVLDKTEQGGMNEVFWSMYAETGDSICRNLAVSFYQDSYFDPIQQGKDHLKGWHSNSFIPNVVGIAREFEVQGDVSRKQMSERFWQQVVETRSFITGGTSNGEHWNTDPYHLHSELGPGAHESCCTYNMIKLSDHLWKWSTDIRYQEYMERALTNAILPTQNRETGMSMYYVSMAYGYYKTWSTPDSSFWCCTGTGMENFSRTAEYIYSVEDNRLYVNQFIPSELHYAKNGFTLIQETSLPEGNTVAISVNTEKPVNLKMAVRIPSWTGNDYSISMNGKPISMKPMPGSYFMIDRQWRSGDKLEIEFTPYLWYSLLPVDNKNVAFGYGPLVLAAKFKEATVDEKLRHRYGPYDGTPVEVPPIQFDTRNFNDFVKEEDKTKRHFKVTGINGEEILLVPFHEVHREHFSVYLPVGNRSETNHKRVDPSEHI
jgi:uncharacterized protein